MALASAWAICARVLVTTGVPPACTVIPTELAPICTVQRSSTRGVPARSRVKAWVAAPATAAGATLATASAALVVKPPPARLTTTSTSPSTRAVKPASAAVLLIRAAKSAATVAGAPTGAVSLMPSMVRSHCSPGMLTGSKMTLVALAVKLSVAAELPTVNTAPAALTITTWAPSALAA